MKKSFIFIILGLAILLSTFATLAILKRGTMNLLPSTAKQSTNTTNIVPTNPAFETVGLDENKKGLLIALINQNIQPDYRSSDINDFSKIDTSFYARWIGDADAKNRILATAFINFLPDMRTVNTFIYRHPILKESQLDTQDTKQLTTYAQMYSSIPFDQLSWTCSLQGLTDICTTKNKSANKKYEFTIQINQSDNSGIFTYCVATPASPLFTSDASCMNIYKAP